jgi:RHS repeat-associated protein
MQYDAENRQTQFTSGSTTVTYHYDGDGRRVKQAKGSETTVFVYDAFGNLAADYSTAQATGTAGRYYRTTDHLGSTRLVTNSTGGVVSRHDFGPFGEELAASSSAGNRNLVLGFGNTSFRQKFTGKERDIDSNLDYFIARYYSSPMGRFNSVDPGGVGAGVSNPQSWNAYAYVYNNPLAFVDPLGLQSEEALKCAADNACTLNVPVTVYYDQSLTQDQITQLSETLSNAQKDYTSAGITFDFNLQAAQITPALEQQAIEGKGLSIVAVASRDGSKPGTQGNAVSLPLDTATSETGLLGLTGLGGLNSVSHEVGHILLGHNLLPRPKGTDVASRAGRIGMNVTLDVVTDPALTMQAFGVGKATASTILQPIPAYYVLGLPAPIRFGAARYGGPR